jgi:hypothetical protein
MPPDRWGSERALMATSGSPRVIPAPRASFRPRYEGTERGCHAIEIAPTCTTPTNH